MLMEISMTSFNFLPAQKVYKKPPPGHETEG